MDSKYTGQEYIIKVLHKSLKAMAAVPRGVSKATKNRAPVSLVDDCAFTSFESPLLPLPFFFFFYNWYIQ